MKRIVLLLTVVLGSGVLLTILNQAPKQVIFEFNELQITTSAEIEAGEPIGVEISGLGVGQNGVVTVESAMGWFSEEFIAGSESESFEIVTTGPVSGLIEVSIVTDDSAASTTATIKPGSAITPVPVFTGQRRAEVGGEESTMAVAIPTDDFGNPVASGVDVTFEITRPNGESSEVSDATAKFIASIITQTETLSGRSTIRASVGSEIGREESFLEVPSQASNIEVAVTDPLPLADGRTEVVVNLSGLVDEFGNTISDGSLVNLLGTGPSGSLSVSGISIEGQAELVFSAPSEPGQLTFVATARGFETEPVILEFEPALNGFNAEISTSEDRLKIGPVKLVSGILAPPGTQAKITFSDGQQQNVDLVQGEAEIRLDGLKPVSVTVLGKEVEVRNA